MFCRLKRTKSSFHPVGIKMHCKHVQALMGGARAGDSTGEKQQNEEALSKEKWRHSRAKYSNTIRMIALSKFRNVWRPLFSFLDVGITKELVREPTSLRRV